MLEFEATIVRLPGKIAWPVFYVPASFANAVGSKSRINVRAVVDGAEFRCTLLPSSNGHYLVYTQVMREHCGKELGGTVQVMLTRPPNPRARAAAGRNRGAGRQRGTALAKFSALPYYIRREDSIRSTAPKRRQLGRNGLRLWWRG